MCSVIGDAVGTRTLARRVGVGTGCFLVSKLSSRPGREESLDEFVPSKKKWGIK